MRNPERVAAATLAFILGVGILHDGAGNHVGPVIDTAATAVHFELEPHHVPETDPYDLASVSIVNHSPAVTGAPTAGYFDWPKGLPL